MSEWKMRPIGDICLRVTSGGTPSRTRPELYEPAVFPWVKTGDLNDSYVTKYSEYLSPEGVSESSAKLLPAETVLMAMYGATVGKLGILQESATCNQASCAMIVNPAIGSPRWLFYALLNVRDEMINLANGAAQQNLNGSTIKNFPILTPPLPTQQAIAEVLGALDDKIAANTKLAATADEYIRASLAELTADATELITIEKLTANRKELTDPNSLDPNDNYVGLEHIPRRSMWLNAAGTADAVTSTKAGFHAGDILFGKLRPYFHKVISAPFAGVCSTDILVLAPLSADLSGFVLASVASDFVVERVTAASEGTRMPRTSWKDLAAVEVAWPGAEKARQFSVGVSTLRQSIESLVRENTKLAATRDALLPQLMSGKLRVKDAEALVSAAV